MPKKGKSVFDGMTESGDRWCGGALRQRWKCALTARAEHPSWQPIAARYQPDLWVETIEEQRTRMKNLLRLIAVLGCALAVSGCASIIKSNEQTIALRSTPPGATVEILNHKGQTVFSGVTPTAAKLDTSRGFFAKAEYTVNYEKTGYVPITAQISGTARDWYYANIMNLFVGYLIVDPMTGAMWRLDVPGDTLQPKLDLKRGDL